MRRTFLAIVLLFIASICAYGQTSTTTVSALKFNGRSSPPSLSTTTTGTLYYDLTTHTMLLSFHGGAYATLPNSVTGVFSTSVSSPLYTASSGVVIKPGTDSATAIQLQNTAGAPILSAGWIPGGSSVTTFDTFDVGINTQSSTQLSVVESHNFYAVPHYEMFNHAASNGRAAEIAFFRSGGTQGSPSAVTTGMKLGSVYYGGYDASGTAGDSSLYLSYFGSAIIQALATENWSSTAHGTKIDVLTTSNQTTGETTALEINQDLSSSFSGAVSVTIAQPASVATSPGTNAPVAFNVNGTTGGNTTITTTGIGGQGSNLTPKTGNGGQATAATTSSTGGQGGDGGPTTGNGGAASVSGSGTNGGGRGGNWTYTIGNGGAASGTSAGATGGGGGTWAVTGGTGGAATGTGTNNGGAGTTENITAGTGGNSSGGSTNNGGNGGSINLKAAPGGTGATLAGTPGDITFSTSSGTGAASDRGRWRGTTSNLEIVSGSNVDFSSTTASNGTVDLGIHRNGVGILEIDNGTAGTFRDLQARNVLLSQTVTNYNGVATAGGGVAAILGFTSQKAETGSADANVLTVTPPAAAGTYRVSVVVSVSSATSGVISWTLTYKDSNANTQTAVAQQIFQQGTAAPNTTFTTSAAGNYYGNVLIDVDNSATAIVVKWVGGGTTAAKMTASIQRLN